MLIGTNPHERTALWSTLDPEIYLHHFRYSVGGLDCLPHTHGEYNVVFCLDGRMAYDIRNREQVLEPGDVLVINPGDVHFGHYGYEALESVGFTLHVTVRALKEIFRKMHLPVDVEGNDILFLEKVNEPSTLALVQQLLKELETRQNGYEIVAQSLVLQLLIYLLRRCLRPSIKRSLAVRPRQLPSWQMVRAFEYMNAHGKSSFNLSELCSHIGTSSSRFIQLFQNSVSLSPHAYYNQLIVQKAQRLLRTGSLSVKEISYELGFTMRATSVKCSAVVRVRLRELSGCLLARDWFDLLAITSSDCILS